MQQHSGCNISAYGRVEPFVFVKDIILLDLSFACCSGVSQYLVALYHSYGLHAVTARVGWLTASL